MFYRNDHKILSDLCHCKRFNVYVTILPIFNDNLFNNNKSIWGPDQRVE